MHVIDELADERDRLVDKWGLPDYPNGTSPTWGDQVDRARAELAKHVKHGMQTWRQVLDAEVKDTFTQANPALLRVQLLRTAAVAVAWIEALDRRAAEARKHELDEENLLCACGYRPSGVELVEARTSLHQHYRAHGGYVG